MLLKDALQVYTKDTASQDEASFFGDVSESWSIKGIPHGGYALGLILRAVSAFQAATPHPDPIHTTAYYLQPLDVGASEVRVKRIRAGRKMANLSAEFVQNGTVRITAHLVYGVLPDLAGEHVTSSAMTLVPPSPLARRIPLALHPSRLKPDPPDPYWLGQTVSEDQLYTIRNMDKARRRTPSVGAEAGDTSGLEWAAWIGLADKTDGPLEYAMLPFFADCMKNLPSLLPEKSRPGPSWYATVVLTIEFKSKIPLFEDGAFSSRTIGLYTSARFMTEGRHDEYVELWTAPADIGSDARHGLDPNWREKQICLAISTQMALTIPESKSRRSEYKAPPASKL